MWLLAILEPWASAQQAGEPLAVPLQPSTAPHTDLSHARAIRSYRDQRLVLREVSRTEVGVDYVAAGVYGRAGRRVGVAMVPQPFAVRTQEWVVVEGARRLDVPSTWLALEEPARADALSQKIRTHRAIGNLGYAVGAAGLLGSVVGMVQVGGADTWRDHRYWSQVSTVSAGVMLGGFIGGSIPAARADRLQNDHARSFDLAELDARFAAHNEALAQQLGLSATEAAHLDGR
ncbi:MAG: hypothetical protein ABMA64_43360 [Myxococcota bacterium]